MADRTTTLRKTIGAALLHVESIDIRLNEILALATSAAEQLTAERMTADAALGGDG